MARYEPLPFFLPSTHLSSQRVSDCSSRKLMHFNKILYSVLVDLAAALHHAQQHAQQRVASHSATCYHELLLITCVCSLNHTKINTESASDCFYLFVFYRAPAPVQQKQQAAPPAHAPQQSGGGGMLSGMASTIAQGFAFGTGSSIAH
eukprot:858-Heterococcus_DN1.PRE.1